MAKVHSAPPSCSICTKSCSGWMCRAEYSCRKGASAELTVWRSQNWAMSRVEYSDQERAADPTGAGTLPSLADAATAAPTPF